MTTPIIRCAGCNDIIDTAFDTPMRDQHGRPWHPTCRAKNASSLWNSIPAMIVLAILFPIVGVIVGVVWLFRERVGPGLGLIATAILASAAYFVLFGL